MALDTTPKLTRRRQLAYALEATNGTAAAVSTTEAVTPVFNAAMNFSTESVDREKEGTLSPRRAGRGARSGTCTFETELFGNAGSGQADWTKLLKMCGLTESTGIYTRTSDPVQTGTLGLYQHGRKKVLAGCMGSFRIAFRRGQAPRIFWNFTGVRGTNADVALITPTKVTTIAPRVGGTFTIGGTTYRTDNLDFESGNVVILREDIDDNSGYRCALITDREARVKIAAEALPFGTKDWQAFYDDSTTAALSVVVGSAGNNTWTLAAPAMELASDPQDGDRAGMLVDTLDFRCLGSVDGAEDDYTLTAT